MTLAPQPESRAVELTPQARPLPERLEAMARRRFQNPKPKRRGQWWVIQVRRDVFVDGEPVRKNRWERIAPATVSAREVLKIVDEHLRPLNHQLDAVGSATNFAHFVDNSYIRRELNRKAKPTQVRYQGVIDNYLKPAFGHKMLRELTPGVIDDYFEDLATRDLSQGSLAKIRNVLASILRRAIRRDHLLQQNPLDGFEMPKAKRDRNPHQPYISYEQCEQLLALIPEPYATMIYTAIWTGLRISELIGLRWEDVHADSLTVDERCCRGDWGAPKSDASNATIGVDAAVIARIERLKELTVDVRAGRAIRHYKLVKSSEPRDLVFQSVLKGKPMRDNNILSRYIKPAGRALGLPFVNWKCLRTSRATWLVQAGVNPKDTQGLMRHSRFSTTMDYYAQMVADSQRDAIAKVTAMVAATQAKNNPPLARRMMN